MSNRSSRLVAVRLVGEESTAQLIFWREGTEIAVQYRRQPNATAPGARWKPRVTLPDNVWPGSRSDIAKSASCGALGSWLSGVVEPSDGSVQIEGIWMVDFSAEDDDALDSGAGQPNNLFTKINKRFSTSPPRTAQVSSLREAAEWIVTGPMTEVDGDLSKWTEPILSRVPVAPAPEGEAEEGIALSDGTSFLPYMTKFGMTNVQFMQTARKHGKYVLLQGPPGTGKSALFEASFRDEYAKAGFHFESDALVMGTADSTVSDLIGGTVQDPATGIFHFKPGKIIKCAQAGLPALVDEALLMDPRVLAVLYPMMTNPYVLPLPEEYQYTDPVSGMENAVKAQPGFWLAFAGNPDVPGAILSEALKSRCRLRPTYNTNWDVVAKILGPAHEEIVTACRNFDTKRLEGMVGEAPQLRELIAYKGDAEIFGTEMAISNLMTFFDSDSDKSEFQEVVARTMHVGNVPEFTI